MPTRRKVLLLSALPKKQQYQQGENNTVTEKKTDSVTSEQRSEAISCRTRKERKTGNYPVLPG